MYVYLFFFFFKQTTEYEMRISDGSSDVCSSDREFGPLQKPDQRLGFGADLSGRGPERPESPARVEFLQSSARLGADFHGDASCPCLIGGGLRARRGGRGMRPCRGDCKQQEEEKGNAGVRHYPCSSHQPSSH